MPGGVAQVDGRLIPGDRLISVNDVHLESATLEQAVQALKGAPRGVVRIGVTKPLPLPEIGESSTDEPDYTVRIVRLLKNKLVRSLVLGQLPLGQLPRGQLPWGQLPRGRLPHRAITPLGQLPPGQLPPGQLPPRTITPVGPLPQGQLPLLVGQLPLRTTTHK